MKKEQELKEEAIRLDACKVGLADWDNPSDEELIDRYFRHIDFCIEHDYPSVEYIKGHFSKEILHKGGVWVDEQVVELDTSRCAMNGKCYGKIRTSGAKTCTMYIRHQSEIELVASGASRLFVYLYDDAKLRVSTQYLGRVYVYRHGGEIVGKSGDVVVRERRKEVR